MIKTRDYVVAFAIQLMVCAGTYFTLGWTNATALFVVFVSIDIGVFVGNIYSDREWGGHLNQQATQHGAELKHLIEARSREREMERMKLRQVYTQACDARLRLEGIIRWCYKDRQTLKTEDHKVPHDTAVMGRRHIERIQHLVKEESAN